MWGKHGAPCKEKTIDSGQSVSELWEGAYLSSCPEQERSQFLQEHSRFTGHISGLFVQVSSVERFFLALTRSTDETKPVR